MDFIKRSSITILMLTVIILSPARAQETPIKDNLIKHVYTLAADSMMGRKAGTEYSAKAALYITSELENIGIEPLNSNEYRQNFEVFTIPGEYYNLAGIIRGSDPLLHDEYIVIGAHYDHIGYRKGAKDKTVIYNGADDNASGTALLIELARQLNARQEELRRSVIIVFFDAEEIGLFGSLNFILSLQQPEAIKLMINMDMVGWLEKGKRLLVEGTGTFKGGDEFINEVPYPESLKIKYKKKDIDIYGTSDHLPFLVSGIPAINITTGLKSPYHSPKDTAEKIDYNGMSLITEYITNLSIAIINKDTIIPCK